MRLWWLMKLMLTQVLQKIRFYLISIAHSSQINQLECVSRTCNGRKQAWTGRKRNRENISNSKKPRQEQLATICFSLPFLSSSTTQFTSCGWLLWIAALPWLRSSWEMNKIWDTLCTALMYTVITTAFKLSISWNYHDQSASVLRQYSCALCVQDSRVFKERQT